MVKARETICSERSLQRPQQNNLNGGSVWASSRLRTICLKLCVCVCECRRDVNHWRDTRISIMVQHANASIQKRRLSTNDNILAVDLYKFKLVAGSARVAMPWHCEKSICGTRELAQVNRVVEYVWHTWLTSTTESQKSPRDAAAALNANGTEYKRLYGVAPHST